MSTNRQLALSMWYPHFCSRFLNTKSGIIPGLQNKVAEIRGVFHFDPTLPYLSPPAAHPVKFP